MENGTSLLHYSSSICPGCISHNVSRNGTYIRDVHGHNVRVQKYICRDCSYSFEARPPGYGYGKHIPDDVRRKTVELRALSSLRRTARNCRISPGIHVSHETVRKSLPPIQDYGRMESSGYFSYDEQYVNIGGKRKYRFLPKDTITGGFHEATLPDLGEMQPYHSSWMH